ncbi:hypothetical protein [Salipiger sp. CCB-MM3]|uniref:hypothetical protein n=1 Tax=Salipiger sp. CCB-MM3 TaxID=1792508 RepID=UPI0012F93854|nr:hypothetical protein [Salipiger sp. CCB-MM3]
MQVGYLRKAPRRTTSCWTTSGCSRFSFASASALRVEEHQDIIHRKVEPGTYHLYFGTNDEVNLDAYEIGGVDQDGLEEILILSREPLELTPK